MKEETRPRPYKCRRCGRQFVRLEHLQRHDRSHTKEKPFKCSLCPQAFTRRDLLTRHHRLTHEKEGQLARTSSISSKKTTKQHESARSPSYASPTLQSHDITRKDSSHQVLELESVNHFGQTRSPLDPGQGIPLETLSGAQAEYISSGSSQGYPPEIFNVDYFDFLLNDVTLPTNPFSPTFQPPPYFSPEMNVSPSGYNEVIATDNSPSYGPPPENPESGLSRFGSRLPSLQPEDHKPPPTPPPKKDTRPFQRVTIENCSRFATLLTRYTDVVEKDFVLPSRHSLHRFISGYIGVFHEHFPVLHIPTLCFDDMSLELFLSISALGAQYCREWDKARSLFRAGKAVAFEHISRRASRKVARKSSILSTDQWQLYNESPDSRTSNERLEEFILGSPDSCQRELESVQAFVLLIALGMWSKVNPAASDALSMRSVLEQLLNDLPPKVPHRRNVGPWRNWIACESLKRTKLIGYCFFNLCTLVFDVPPTYMFTTINIALPSTQKEWAATNERSWMESRPRKTQAPQFLDAYWYLFSDSNEDIQAPKHISSLGCYVLIHAVIQHVWLLQKAAKSLPAENTISSITATSSVERALKRWRNLWEHDQEASIDPLSPHGPLSFNSTALLRIAYIRLSIDSGSVRSLASWDAQHIATSLYNSPTIHRSTKTTRAALHCAHALSVPIKLGISYVAHTQVFFWSNQHALCSLECALLLSKWLLAVTAKDLQPERTKDEERLLDFVLQMVVETEYAASQEYLLENNTRLAAVVVRIWAKLYQAESVWEMVEMIGKSLNLYADLLQRGQIAGEKRSS